MNMKQELGRLIEAYAAARLSGNETLLKYAAEELSALLNKVELIEAPVTSTNEDPTDD
jgi:hypothetical protein